MLGALGLARLEFAATTSVHFLFVLLTLGLVTVLAVSQTRYARTGDPELGRATRFWGQRSALRCLRASAPAVVRPAVPGTR